MEHILVALQLLTGLFGALKAYFEYKRSREEDDDEDSDTREHRPKHLKR